MVALPLLMGRLGVSSADGALQGGFPVLVNPADKAAPVDLAPVPPAGGKPEICSHFDGPSRDYRDS